MHYTAFLFALAIAMTATVALCDPAPATVPATRPTGLWDSKWFTYARAAAAPAVEETTPTAAQVDFGNRPPTLRIDAEPKAMSPAKPRTVGPLDIVHLRFRDANGEDVTALLCKPAGAVGPLPVVIALHGVGSNKAQVCAQVAPAFAAHGFAVLAPDLPMHGERPGDPRQFLNAGDLKRMASACRQAVIDVRQCIDVAEARPDLDTKAGVVLAGYSLGALIDSVVGPCDARVKAMLLMVGGTVDFPPAFTLMPDLCALQPQLAIPHFAGRPVLMLNGTDDMTITREMGERLFAAAAEPKQQRWYDCGHLLPNNAYEDGAAWVAKTWKTVAK